MCLAAGNFAALPDRQFQKIKQLLDLCAQALGDAASRWSVVEPDGSLQILPGRKDLIRVEPA